MLFKYNLRFVGVNLLYLYFSKASQILSEILSEMWYKVSHILLDWTLDLTKDLIS